MSKKKKRHLQRLKDEAKSQPGWIGWLEKEIQRQAKANCPGQGRRVNRSTKHRVLLRDAGCVGCGYNEDLTLHHVLPKRLGGTNHAENLVCLCGECHRQWNAAEASGQWKWFEFYQWL